MRALEPQLELEPEPSAERHPICGVVGDGVMVIALDKQQARELNCAIAWAGRRMQPSARVIYDALYKWLECAT